VTTQLLKLHAFLGIQLSSLYIARVANAVSFRSC